MLCSCAMRARATSKLMHGSHRPSVQRALASRTAARRPTLDSRVVIDLSGKTLLVTGGTGSFGTAFIRTVLARHDVALDPRVQPRRAQAVRAAEFAPGLAGCAGCWATCATATRLQVASRGVDVIVHAAALKQVPACEYNPFEAVQTNIMGAAERHLGGDRQRRSADDRAQHGQGRQPGQPLRRDQAVRREDRRAGRRLRARAATPRFASVRYGNVVGSRGSVVPIFKAAGRRRASSRSPTSA